MASNSKQHIMIFIDSIDHDSAFSRRLNLNSIDIFGGDDNNDGVLAFRDSEGRKNNDILLVLKSPSSYFLQVLIKCVNKTTGAELLKLGSEEYDQQTYLSINFPMYRKLVSIKTPKTKRRRLSDISTPMPMTDYSCQVCLGVPCGEVYECSNEHIFCAECLKEHMKQSAAFSQYCPLCRVTLPSSDQPTRRPLIEEIIANSPAKCLHCPTSLITKDLPHHGMVCRGVYNKLKKMEYKQPNDPIPKQLHVTGQMRSVLVDWLIDVHRVTTMVPTTLFNAVACIDAFLRSEQVPVVDLQLVGIVALMIACRGNDLDPIKFTTGDVIYVTDYTYKAEQVEAMEQSILSALGGYPQPQPSGAASSSLPLSPLVPSTLDFLSRFVVASGCNSIVAERARYFAERSLMDHSCLVFKPSLVAASCLCLSMTLTPQSEAGQLSWGRLMRGFTGYSHSAMLKCANLILAQLRSDEVRREPQPRLDACTRKFTQESLHAVAVLKVGPGFKDFTRQWATI